MEQSRLQTIKYKRLNKEYAGGSDSAGGHNSVGLFRCFVNFATADAAEELHRAFRGKKLRHCLPVTSDSAALVVGLADVQGFEGTPSVGFRRSNVGGAATLVAYLSSLGHYLVFSFSGHELDAAAFVGMHFNQSLDKVTLPNSLQSLAFGDLWQKHMLRLDQACSAASANDTLMASHRWELKDE